MVIKVTREEWEFDQAQTSAIEREHPAEEREWSVLSHEHDCSDIKLCYSKLCYRSYQRIKDETRRQAFHPMEF